MTDNKDELRTLYCSFCGKSQHEVKKLIAGPTVFICDECVVLCIEIIVEGDFVTPSSLTREARLLLRESAITNLVQGVEAILEQEGRSREQYAKLAGALKNFEEHEKSLRPTTIEAELPSHTTPNDGR